MAEKGLKNSLKYQMTKMMLGALILLAIIIIASSIGTVYSSLVHQVEQELERDANLAILMYDKVYDGDFTFVEEENGDISVYKGDEPITGNVIMLDSLADILNIDISLFFGETRILTTLQDEDGNRAFGTTVASTVKKSVIDEGEAVFYTNVLVYDEKSFAYYMPLKDDNDEVYGMIAVSREGDEVKAMAMERIWPIVLVCVITTFLIGYAMVQYIKRVAARISAIDKFMNTLANGKFDTSMPSNIMDKDDEIKRLAMDGKKMARSIKTLVEYDALTGINNRRFADKKLEDIRIRAVETGVNYCVSIGDIDFFKKVNDSYGHEMGDLVLKMVAETLKKGMVGKGFVARWGGEEFLLVFENIEIKIAERELYMILEEIRKIIVPDTDRQITMSFGLTKMNPMDSIDDTLKHADDKLYEAKENGRNRIVY